MLSTINFPKLQLNDVLLRLDKHEQQVCALASHTARGWGTALAWNPKEIFQHTNANVQDVLTKLEQFTDRQREKGRLVIGYMAYDFGCLLNNVTPTAPDNPRLPLVVAFSFDNWITFHKHHATLHVQNPDFETEVTNILARPSRTTPKTPYQQPFAPTQSRAAYTKAYNKVKDYIQAGDVYQVNLTHQLKAKTSVDGRSLFCLLSQSSGADFQAYIEGDGFEVVSVSPERFIHIKQGVIEAFPVKGTRPRGTNTAQDKALRTDLMTNPKDRAELNMIIDLMRNDLGAICKVGSVQVQQQRLLTAYPTLWHAHAAIEGRLQAKVRPITALAAMMPGGSITGCPKKRAIEIINELEPVRRGVYSGSIFTIKPDGELDSSIAIRTIIKKSHDLFLSVGGGIVYDSTEENEYLESINKAASFMRIGN